MKFKEVKSYFKKRELLSKFDKIEEQAFKQFSSRDGEKPSPLLIERVESIEWRANVSRADYTRWLMQSKFAKLFRYIEREGMRVESAKLSPGDEEEILRLKIVVSVDSEEQARSFYRKWEASSGKTVFNSARLIKDREGYMSLRFDVYTETDSKASNATEPLRDGKTDKDRKWKQAWRQRSLN